MVSEVTSLARARVQPQPQPHQPQQARLARQGSSTAVQKDRVQILEVHFDWQRLDAGGLAAAPE